MSFSINPYKLPCARSYADALKVWEDAIKVKDSEWRHLGSKRDASKRVRLKSGTVSFRYHNTDVVKWHAHDHVEVTFWDSTSTGLFASRFLPPGSSVNKSVPMIVNGMQPQLSSINFHLVDNKWEADPDDVEVEYQAVADPKKVRAAQKRVREYLEYRRARSALEGQVSYTNSSPGYAMRHIDCLERPLSEAHVILRWVREDFLLRAAAVVAGAVTREPLPLGQRPTKSVYDPFL